MKNKKVVKRVLYIVLICILPLLIEFIRSNYGIINSPKREQAISIVETKNGDVSYDQEGNKIYEIKNIERYIKKLDVKYQTTKSGPVVVTVMSLDQYGNSYEKTIGGNCISEIGSSTFIVDEVVSKITISNVNVDTTINSLTINNTLSFNIYVFLLLLFAEIIITYIYYVRKNILKKIHIIFIMLILTMGTVFIVTSPNLAYFGFDEQIHMNNSYNISYFGNAYQSKSVIYANKSGEMYYPNTKDDNQKLDNYLNSQSMSQKDLLISKTKIIEYNQMPYVIISLFIAIGSWLGASFTQIFMIGKFANLLFYTVVCGYSLMRATKGKKLLFVLMLMPTSLFIATHYTLDGIIISCFMLAIVLFLEMYRSDNKIRQRDMVLFVAAVSLASLAKAIYAPILLLPLLLNKEKFNNVKQSKFFKLSVVILFTVLIATFVLPILSGTIVSDSRIGNTSVIGQLQTILMHPVAFLQMFFGTIIKEFGSMFFSHSIFTNFGYVTNVVPYNYVLIYSSLLVYAIFVSAGEMRIQNTKHRYILLLGSLLLISFVYGTMYLSFTPVAKMGIDGVQARYFIPLLLPIIICISPNISIKIKNEIKANTIFTMTTVAYLTAITFFVLSHFYL